jgi:NTP pyrophosphatase (non-canonical NTP hydrolase)
MKINDYIAEAGVTVSPAFHLSKVSLEYFAQVVSVSIDALQALDGIKKSLFYGRVLEHTDKIDLPDYEEFAGNNCINLVNEDFGEGEKSVDMLHAILGIATEAGELLEVILNRVLSGKVIDKVNIAEEIGDILWYQALALKTLNSTFEQEMSRNIAKLRHRFPEKFNEFDANNRDLLGERKVLES